MSCNCCDDSLSIVQVHIPGLQGAQGKTGETGATGAPGRDGADGVTPDIQAEAVTLESGAAATVTRSGDNAKPVFTFGIPKGDKGDKGDKGETAQIEVASIENLF